MDTRRQRQLRAAEGFLLLGMPDHALESLTHVSDPGDDAFLFCLLNGKALQAKRDHQQALNYYEQAHALKPDQLDTLLGMAWCYKRVDRLDQSIATMKIAYDSHPKVPVVLYNLACYYSLAGRKDQALSWLGRALRMNRGFCKLIAAESDFDPLRGDADFRHLLELSTED
jgi:tetratricopeptide (TPR) repeat protein